MNWIFPIAWIVGAVAVYLLSRGMMNVQARYRTLAAGVAGAFWPIWAIMLAAFLLADLIEWLVRLVVGRADSGL